MLLTLALLAQLALPAFPGAMGAGAVAVGGRGGVVYNVTSLADTTNGGCSPFNPDNVICTLRDCVSAKGPRNCIFRVSGLITQTSPLVIHNPNITIPGQTAPGGGIVQGGIGQNGQALAIETPEAIIRYLTYDGAASPADGNTCNHDTGTVGYEVLDNNNFNIVIDHTSHRWWGNKDMEVVSNGPNQNAHDLTVSNNLFYEPCFDHPVVTEPDVFSGGSQSASVNQDWHHNLAINYDHRWPLGAIRSMRWVNNVGFNGIQNSDSFNTSFWGAIQLDVIGSNYMDGPNSTQPVFNIAIQPDPTSSADPADCNPTCDNGPAQGRAPTVYLLNNGGHWGKAVNTPSIPATNVPNDVPNVSMLAQVTNAEGAFNPSVPPSSWLRSTPLPAEQFPIIADQVTDFDTKTLPTVGNSQHLDCLGNWVSNRDSQDQRVIAQYQAQGKGGPWEGPTYTGPHFPGAPPIPPGTPCVESLHDGIPDQWKVANHLSTTDPNLYKTPAPNGYTYLENYLNGQGTTPPPVGWTGYLGSDALPGAAIGATVTVGATAGPLRSSACTVAGGAAGAPVAGAPSMIGLKVTILAGPSPVCSTGGVAFWQVTTGTTPPPHPTVTCNPTTVSTGLTSFCTADQTVTWSASAGTITSAGVFTAPATAQTVTITGTNSNGSGTVPVQVTAAPPVVAYPVVNLAIVSNGSTMNLTCTANQTTGVYTCK